MFEFYVPRNHHRSFKRRATTMPVRANPDREGANPSRKNGRRQLLAVKHTAAKRDRTHFLLHGRQSVQPLHPDAGV